MRNLQHPGRSVVRSLRGMVASSHTLSSSVGIEILQQGGNALDAAIAMCAVQCVVEPGSTGIGGDNYCLYSKGGTDKIVAYNGSGKTPSGLTLDRLKSAGITQLTRTSAHSVIIPGAVDAWCRLNADYGKLPLSELLRPAIHYAEHGYPITERVHFDWQNNSEHLSSDKNLSSIFLPVPLVGEIHKQPELAKALELISTHGRSAFYEGELAKSIVSTLESKGGFHTLDDFATYEGNYVTPITTTYRGRTIHECPPNGQGVIALLLLNMFETRGDKSDCLTPERIHFELECCRRAYGARGLYLSDSDSMKVPMENLINKDFAHRLVDSIGDDASPDNESLLSITPHRDTVYITAIDKDRNVCSFINTLFWGWGGGITTSDYGIVLTNRGEGFVLDESHPNCIGPSKRPLHTIIPAMVSSDGLVELSFGVMGGEYQAMGHAQFLSRYYDFGLDLQQSQDVPRFMVDPFTGLVEIEDRVQTDILDSLRDKGHNITIAEAPIGGSQAISIDWQTGILSAGSDCRKDGCAIGY